MIAVNGAWPAIRLLGLTVLFVTVCRLAAGADYEAGKRAWDASKPTEALTQWRAAADAGDRRAMLALGRLYVQGLGAPQDYVLAHMWFNLAASRGEMAALKERDDLAAKMTPQQVAAAQERAREWRTGGGRADKPKAATDHAVAAPPPRAIREAQELLAALGYKPGAADGKWGARSAKAYIAFLRDAGLPSGDTLTPEGLRAMRAVAKRRREGTSAATRRAEPERPTSRRPPRDAVPRAVLAGNIDGLKVVLKAGADVNARDGQGWTALMHAAEKGYKLMVRPLLEARADPDVQAADGATALFMAAVHGHAEIIELLTKFGANASIKGPKGKTAMDVARVRYNDADTARNEGPAVFALWDGKWGELVRQRDDAALAKARSVGTATAYATYLSGHWWSRHADRVRRLKAAVEQFKRRFPKSKAFRDCPDCPEMVRVPPGEFMMGSPSGEWGRHDNEGPRHRVTILEPFAAGKYEVTRGQYRKFVRETGYKSTRGCYEFKEGEWYKTANRSWEKPGFTQGERDPVVCVRWEDAKAYVKWLSKKTRKTYRLMSEAEWEYAARGGTETRAYWHEEEGDQCEYANGADEMMKGFYEMTTRTAADWTVASCDDGHVHTAGVGSYRRNGYGLRDVLGNVWEWVEDCEHGNYEGAPTDGSVWTSGGDCGNHVVRGSSWVGGPKDLRSAHRHGVPAGARYTAIGFRIARTLLP